MKKILNMVLVAAAVGVIYADDSASDVVMSNVLAIRQVPSTLSEIVVPVPFKGVGGGTATLDSIIPEGNLGFGDTVRVMIDSPDGYFNLWTAIPNVSGVDPLYPSQRVISSSKTVPAVGAGDQLVPQGSALIVAHAAGTSPIYVMGEYVNGLTNSTVKAKTRTYLSNPMASAFNLNNIQGDTSDRIWVYTGTEITGTSVREYRYNSSGYWYYQTRSPSGFVFGSVQYKTVNHTDKTEIPSGAGFVYLRNGASDLNFQWK